MNKIKSVFHISIFLFFAANMAHGQLLLDRFVTENPAGAINWSRAGVTEDLSKAVIGAIGNAANEPIIYNITRLSATEQGANDVARPNNPALGGVRFPGNPLLNSYVWFRGNTYRLTIRGFVDAEGQPVTITSTPQAPYENVQGNHFEIRPNQAYRLYLFGVGYRDGEQTSFTFHGETKVSTPVDRVVNTEENLHVVVFEFTTPWDLFEWDLTITAEGVGATGVFNGLALVPVGQW